MAVRKICVVSGSRSEYSLLYWLLRGIEDDPDLELQFVVTGMHLSSEFGMTYREIEEDCIPIADKLEILLSGDSWSSITKSIGLGTIGFADLFKRLKPDLLVLLGDRFESLAAAQAAMVANVPIAHIHGGELTKGLVDEAIRHSITKMSQLHFVATEAYRKRVIQLGEQPDRVFNFGAPGVEAIKRSVLLSRDEVVRRIGFDLGKSSFLITYHPVTLSKGSQKKAASELFKSLDEFPDSNLIITYPNADAQGRELIEEFEKYASKNGGRVYLTPSLGRHLFLSVLQFVDVFIGNSSSGLIEVPFFQIPTVNIGERQRGRIQGESIIQCDAKNEEITAAIKKGMSVQFKGSLKDYRSPYGDGDTSRKIIEKIKTVDLKGILMKFFYDIEFSL
ncbi:MAG: UDP-N-acetylglucosamine 2-epimerase (hydrolyzing) [Bdellovibrionales bacterium]|nr:UDP-N-acetylglucosamine 2-epimerase (hydrolyzing) [Bdellovibrionales bacterium]